VRRVSQVKTGEDAGIHRSSWHSECSTDVHESLVACGKPLQLVFGDGVDKCLELDVAKCRKWALEKAESFLPIVTITDCILPFDESQLAQASFFFIDAGLGDRTNYANHCAYPGPRWYHRELAQLIVDTQVKNGRGEPVTLVHFVASITSRYHITATEVANTYRLMTEAVEANFQLEGMKCARSLDDFTKTMILAMQGGWLTRHAYNWKCVDSTRSCDVPPKYGRIFKERILDHETGLTRYMIRNETIASKTMYLLGLHALTRSIYS
jgi:hypothetical protein